MQARTYVLLAGALLGASACSEAPIRQGGPSDGDTPSVLLIVVDTLRADHLGAYGGEASTSPRIDALARSGVRFERYRTVVPTTAPSFTSLLTSRHPHTHGVFRNGVAWPDALEGVQTVFRQGGYETSAFIASYCLSSDFGFDRGFDHFDESLDVARPNLPGNKLTRNGESVTTAVLDWLDGRESSRPFFALVHYFDPHFPYDPPARYRDAFGEPYDGPVTGSLADIEAIRDRLGRNGGKPDADSRRLHALHLAEVRYADEQIGRLLDGLDERGLGGKTLVVLTADHGETFHEHADYFSHGLTVYDTVLRIPLIVRGPGVTGGGRGSARLLSNIDLAPTLLDYAGLDRPEGYEGHSFIEALAGESPADPDRAPATFAEATQPPTVERTQRWPNRLKARCIVDGEFKLILTPWAGDALELYDVAGDPGERHNLLFDDPDPAAHGSGDLLDRLESWSRAEPEVVPEGPGAHPELLERLRSLGYVQ